MDDFINVIKGNPQIQSKIDDMLGRYNRLTCSCQLKVGCDSLIQNDILKQLINIMSSTKTDLGTKIKMKISRIKQNFMRK